MLKQLFHFVQSLLQELDVSLSRATFLHTGEVGAVAIQLDTVGTARLDTIALDLFLAAGIACLCETLPLDGCCLVATVVILVVVVLMLIVVFMVVVIIVGARF